MELVDVAFKADKPVIVMELLNASLKELLSSSEDKLVMAEAKSLIQQVLRAVAFIHEKGVLHRDIACKNILFNTSGQAKVCDFGISRAAFGSDEKVK